MTNRIRRSALVALAVLIVALPMIASASSTDSKLYIGMNLHFTGPTTTEGTFIASGAVEDSGQSQVTELSLVPLGNQVNARLSGRQVFEGQQGTIVTTFSGIAGPLSSPHQSGRGTFKIVSGTGAYEGLRGSGTFLIVVDASTNQLIGTEEGQAN